MVSRIAGELPDRWWPPSASGPGSMRRDQRERGVDARPGLLAAAASTELAKAFSK